MVLGPGGAGVSVVAAAGALALSEGDRSQRGRGGAVRPAAPGLDASGGTVLITVDPRSATPGRLGVFRVPGDPVAVTAELELLHLDPLATLESAWADFAAALSAAGAVRTLLPVVDTLASIAPGELSALPGVQEFLLLRRIRDAATSGRWQRVVVDLSGAGDPFALLRSPTILATTIDRLWPRHARLAEASEKPALAQLAGALENIDRDCQDLRELFADSSAVAAHLVVGGGERGVQTAPDLLAIADLTGLPLRSVHLNPGPGGLDVAAAEASVRAALGDGEVRVTTASTVDVGLDRAARLRKLDVVLPDPGGTARGAGAPVVRHVEGHGLESVYELSWRQGLPDPATLALGRSGDDLLVTVAGFRAPVLLPSVLRRCVVTGADWDGTRLVVRFAPDPAVWPQAVKRTPRGATTSRLSGRDELR
ncbi:MAG: ArsA-related P-loop ATPase [Gordonia sp. (in: high G+C Gram-positive bacteria)]